VARRRSGPMPIHEEVLAAARRLAANEKDGSFAVRDILALLPHLKENTVRTHVVSRCCVNAPKNHPHKWEYFRRIGRGRYRIETKYRSGPAKTNAPHPLAASRTAEAFSRRPKNEVRNKRSIHAVIHKDEETYVVECLELPVVTQGSTLDEAVANLREALALHLEGEDLSALGLSAHPDVQISYEIPAA
jgi:predicted RNase H-like HicB family nuclease